MLLILPRLSTHFADAFRLARGRLLTLFSLALYPLLPLALFSPFIAQVFVAIGEGAASPEEIAAGVAPWVVGLAVVGLLLSLVVSVASAAGMFIALGRGSDLGPRVAFSQGGRVWLHVTWTQVLAALAVAAMALPAILLSWLGQMMLASTLTENSMPHVLLFLILVLLILPALAVATWYAFAVIPAARGEAYGSTALTVSHQLVHGATVQVFGLLFAWTLFEFLFWLLLAVLFPGLTLLQGVTYYFVTSILGAAYLVAVYNALRRT